MLSSWVSAVHAQRQLPKDPCHAAGLDPASTGFLGFDQFDRELRSAIERQDAISMAFLVNFPLRVNDAGGTISIDDAKALKTHFNEVFTAAVRKEILSTPAETGCSIEGVGYGRGVIWVEGTDHGYAISVVNRDAVPPYPIGKKDPGPAYVCSTKRHRIVIDSANDGDFRYRAWRKPRPLTQAPDLSMKNGEQTFEGTDLCAVPVWTFHNGRTTYVVSGGLGCDAESKDSAGTTGDLVVSEGEKTLLHDWCF
jgi:hypothetical protein